MKDIYQKIIGITLFFCFALFILFSNNALVEAIKNLGPVGDFVAGILSPLFNVLNLVLLIYVAKEVKEYELRNSSQAIDIQRAMAKTQFRHDAYREFMQILTKHDFFNKASAPQTSVFTKDINADIKNFLSQNEHLFSKFKEFLNPEPIAVMDKVYPSLDYKDVSPALIEIKAYMQECIYSELDSKTV